MNKYVRVCLCMPYTALKLGALTLLHPKRFTCSLPVLFSPRTEITMNRGGRLRIGRRFQMRGGSRIRVRENAQLSIGQNTALNHGCMLVCWERITIGEGVQFSPNVLVYDHDHDFRAGLQNMQFRTSPVEIGNNVWIGAGTVILRGSKIGDNCVIGAGCIIKGTYPAGTLVVQKRQDTCVALEPND
jgi:acetyltransferase-like isoleucine patch superfamily enzyme